MSEIAPISTPSSSETELPGNNKTQSPSSLIVTHRTVLSGGTPGLVALEQLPYYWRVKLLVAKKLNHPFPEVTGSTPSRAILQLQLDEVRAEWNSTHMTQAIMKLRVGEKQVERLTPVAAIPTMMTEPVAAILPLDPSSPSLSQLQTQVTHSSYGQLATHGVRENAMITLFTLNGPTAETTITNPTLESTPPLDGHSNPSFTGTRRPIHTTPIQTNPPSETVAADLVNQATSASRPVDMIQENSFFTDDLSAHPELLRFLPVFAQRNCRVRKCTPPDCCWQVSQTTNRLEAKLPPSNMVQLYQAHALLKELKLLSAMHQLEKETNLTFDLTYFRTLISNAAYIREACDYIFSFELPFTALQSTPFEFDMIRISLLYLHLNELLSIDIQEALDEKQKEDQSAQTALTHAVAASAQFNNWMPRSLPSYWPIRGRSLWINTIKPLLEEAAVKRHQLSTQPSSAIPDKNTTEGKFYHFLSSTWSFCQQHLQEAYGAIQFSQLDRDRYTNDCMQRVEQIVQKWPHYDITSSSSANAIDQISATATTPTSSSDAPSTLTTSVHSSTTQPGPSPSNRVNACPIPQLARFSSTVPEGGHLIVLDSSSDDDDDDDEEEEKNEAINLTSNSPILIDSLDTQLTNSASSNQSSALLQLGVHASTPMITSSTTAVTSPSFPTSTAASPSILAPTSAASYRDLVQLCLSSLPEIPDHFFNSTRDAFPLDYKRVSVRVNRNLNYERMAAATTLLLMLGFDPTNRSSKHLEMLLVVIVNHLTQKRRATYPPESIQYVDARWWAENHLPTQVSIRSAAARPYDSWCVGYDKYRRLYDIIPEHDRVQHHLHTPVSEAIMKQTQEAAQPFLVTRPQRRSISSAVHAFRQLPEFWKHVVAVAKRTNQLPEITNPSIPGGPAIQASFAIIKSNWNDIQLCTAINCVQLTTIEQERIANTQAFSPNVVGNAPTVSSAPTSANQPTVTHTTATSITTPVVATVLNVLHDHGVTDADDIFGDDAATDYGRSSRASSASLQPDEPEYKQAINPIQPIEHDHCDSDGPSPMDCSPLHMPLSTESTVVNTNPPSSTSDVHAPFSPQLRPMSNSLNQDPSPSQSGTSSILAPKTRIKSSPSHAVASPSQRGDFHPTTPTSTPPSSFTAAFSKKRVRLPNGEVELGGDDTNMKMAPDESKEKVERSSNAHTTPPKKKRRHSERHTIVISSSDDESEEESKVETPRRTSLPHSPSKSKITTTPTTASRKSFTSPSSATSASSRSSRPHESPSSQSRSSSSHSSSSSSSSQHPWPTNSVASKVNEASQRHQSELDDFLTSMITDAGIDPVPLLGGRGGDVHVASATEPSTQPDEEARIAREVRNQSELDGPEDES